MHRLSQNGHVHRQFSTHNHQLGSQGHESSDRVSALAELRGKIPRGVLLGDKRAGICGEHVASRTRARSHVSVMAAGPSARAGRKPGGILFLRVALANASTVTGLVALAVERME